MPALLPLLVLLALGGCARESRLERAEAAAPARPAPVEQAAPAAASWAEGGAVPDLAPAFGGTPGTIVVLDARTGREVRHDPERSRRRFTPFSTFKIANSLIALETGALLGTDYRMQWDSIRDPRQSGFAGWYRDHDMRSAMRNSVVWYYKEVARRIGPERMRAHLERIGYGNADISGGIDRFWLGSSLRISAEEQVRFLQRFHSGELFSPRATAAVREILVLEETPAYRLSGKTGGGPLGAGALGWLVGYVERDGKVYFYALNLEGRSYTAIADRRHEVARAVLRELGVLPPTPGPSPASEGGEHSGPHPAA
ncbi:MAG TPA: penicillin-binding transpeptidase domain-containing protein [Longimicrobiaceae bacterium]|nr:penicillin-binding transpeptidase domain-containing protein [Longimicrobiaceae bacterium]